MFDFLKGGKVNLAITLDPKQYYRLGDTVQGKLAVENEKELKIQEGHVDLVFRQESEYRYKTEEKDSDGDYHTETHSSWQKEEETIDRVVFLREGTIPTKSSQTFDFSFSIPKQASPTAEGGRIVRANWFIKATLDRKMAADYNSQVALPVYVEALPQQSALYEYGDSNEPDEATVVLHLSNNEWALRETIEGELVVNPKKNFDAAEIRVELARSEDVPRDEGNQAEEKQVVKVAGGTKLQAGQSLKFPFRITIPPTAPPTMQTSQFQVAWKLRGTLARRFRGDTAGETSLYIFNVRGN